MQLCLLQTNCSFPLQSQGTFNRVKFVKELKQKFEIHLAKINRKSAH